MRAVTWHQNSLSVMAYQVSPDQNTKHHNKRKYGFVLTDWLTIITRMSMVDNIESRKIWAVIINCILLISRYPHLQVVFWYQWLWMTLMIVDSEQKSLLQYLLFCEFPKYLLLDFIVAQFSLILIGTGASLMGFYRLQMLEVLNLYFIFVKDFFKSSWNKLTSKGHSWVSLIE